jgi:hypothetical protein
VKETIMRRTIPVLIVLAALTACGPRSDGPAIDQTRLGLQTALTATNAARDAFVAWDKDHQARIVEEATSLDDGKAKLAAYRMQRADVSATFVLAYSAIAGAATALALADTERDTAQLVTMAREALVAVVAVRAAVKQLQEGR